MFLGYFYFNRKITNSSNGTKSNVKKVKNLHFYSFLPPDEKKELMKERKKKGKDKEGKDAKKATKDKSKATKDDSDDDEDLYE
jgi:hypothetical protein